MLRPVIFQDQPQGFPTRVDVLVQRPPLDTYLITEEMPVRETEATQAVFREEIMGRGLAAVPLEKTAGCAKMGDLLS